MMKKAESYLARAEQFEARAQKAQSDTAKAAYEHLAWSYRQLGIHAGRKSNGNPSGEGLPDRIIRSARANSGSETD